MSAARPEIRAVKLVIKITIYQILINAAKYDAGGSGRSILSISILY